MKINPPMIFASRPRKQPDIKLTKLKTPKNNLANSIRE